jgi:hypothetical protein
MNSDIEKQIPFWIENGYNVLFQGRAGIGKCLTRKTLTKVRVSKEVYETLLAEGKVKDAKELSGATV